MLTRQLVLVHERHVLDFGTNRENVSSQETRNARHRRDKLAPKHVQTVNKLYASSSIVSRAGPYNSTASPKTQLSYILSFPSCLATVLAVLPLISFTSICRLCFPCCVSLPVSLVLSRCRPEKSSLLFSVHCRGSSG